MKLVIDASVAIKWFFKEEGADLAFNILQDISQKNILLMEPRIFYFELGNVLWSKKASGKKLIEEVLNILQKINLQFVDFDFEDWRLIMKIAKAYQASFYDLSYFYLAQKLKCDFVTADEKFYQKLKGKKGVKLL